MDQDKPKWRPGKPYKPGGFRPKGKKPGFQSKFEAKKRRKVPPQVLEIARQHNLPMTMAFKVSRQLISLEDAIKQNQEKEARKNEAKAICEKYPKIDFALACLLLKDKITPEDFLKRRQEKQALQREKELEKRKMMQEDSEQVKAFEALTGYSENKTPLQLQKYGGKFEDGILEDFTPYEFYFATNKCLLKIHRLKLKYFYEQSAAAAIKKSVFIDKGIKEKKQKPSYGPEGRYKFPEGLLKEGNEIILALHEGEMIRGKVVWSTSYDILLDVNKQKIWVFRHAVIDCTLTRRPATK